MQSCPRVTIFFEDRSRNTHVFSNFLLFSCYPPFLFSFCFFSFPFFLFFFYFHFLFSFLISFCFSTVKNCTSVHLFAALFIYLDYKHVTHTFNRLARRFDLSLQNVRTNVRSMVFCSYCGRRVSVLTAVERLDRVLA